MTSPRRTRIILHSKVALRPDVRAAVEHVRRNGHDIDVRVTWEPADSINLTTEACESGSITTVVSGGGDGTINAVASAIIQSGVENPPALGVLPLGTANDFARGVGIPSDDLAAALTIAVENEPVPIDAGQAGDRYFVNVATGGFGTEVTVNTPNDMKKVLGKTAYLITGIKEARNLAAKEAHLKAPDFEWRGTFLALGIGNARFAGGAVDMCPEAVINDGLLEVSFLPDVPPAKQATVLQDLLRRGLPAIDDRVEHHRCESLTIASDAGLQINLDGEPMRSKEITFRALPRALRMHLPENCPLLR